MSLATPPLTFELFGYIAAAVAGSGVVLALAGRWFPGLSGFGRALIMTGLAVIVCAAAVLQGHDVLIFAAGFIVCAALHRWLDAFADRGGPEPTDHTPPPVSRSPKVRKRRA